MKRIKSPITFAEFATVLTVCALVGAGFYGVYVAGLKLGEAHNPYPVIESGSLEAKADTLHALKALGQ